MKHIALALATGFLATTPVDAQEAWGGYNHGIQWEASLDAAKARAASEGKPILFHQLVGDLDREGC